MDTKLKTLIHNSPFIRNAWYCVGFSSGLPENQLKAITVLGQPLVLFRTNGGEVAALADRCPHRFAPLSRGSLQGNSLQCGYHGLRFDSSGRCVHNPHFSGVAPEAATVPVFPAFERYGAIWVWMGEHDKADRTLLPDFSATDERSGWNRVEGYLHVKANYQLITDNLLDLSHVQFLHPFLANDAPPSPQFKATMRAEQRGNTVIAINEFSHSSIPPVYRLLWGQGEAPETCQLRANMRWDPPSLLLLDTGAAPVNAPREAGPSLPSAHWLTPESQWTTHYFWAATRDRFLGDATVAAQVKQGIDEAFRCEDEPMIEDVQRNMGSSDLWEGQPVLLSTDNAPVRARRIVEKLLVTERD